jgi:RimJ/RimL family protein N-acetyltransferase
VACLDIKKTENDPTVREMGYWASSDFPGVVTNAVKVLCEFAHNQGIKELFGLVKTDNEKSIAVLNRSKFENQGELKKDGKTYYKFVQKL